MRRGKCILCVGFVFVYLGDVNCYFDGVCLFHYYLKNLTGKHRLMIVQKKRITHQSLVIELRQKFNELGAKTK